MDSTLKARQAEPQDDPHDAPAIAPDVVSAAWADKVLADIKRDVKTPAPGQPLVAGSSAADNVAAPVVDTTFRPTAVGDIRIEGTRPPAGRWAKRVFMALFALGSAIAAAAWQHYGDAATQMIPNWTPPFALTSSPPQEKTGLAEQPNTAAVAASAADQAPSQTAAPAQPADSAAPAAAALAPESAQLIQSMARDLAAMGQQVEQLRASIAELKANQQPAPAPAARTSEVRPSEVRPPAPNPRPKMSAAPPPPRPAAAPAPLRRPAPAYPPVQAATAPPTLAAPPGMPPPPPPPPQAAADADGEPVVRPPLPLRP